MVVRPRSVAAPTSKPVSEWQWHTVPTKSMSVLALARGDRRLEAGTYLSEGHSLRQGFVGGGGAFGWQQLGQLANIWQPSRLKGILVGRQHGTPFLAATQVFDARPAPRKWLSLDRTDAADGRFVSLVSVRDHLESLESFVIRWRLSDSQEPLGVDERKPRSV
jgi:hypothetical protein